jgi:hypothetical protein
MSNDKHTPTPWEAIGETIFAGEHILFVSVDSTVNGIRIDGTEQEANAARIVQCVNEYDGLIETIATLRAEKAELIEALIKIQEWTDKGSDTLARIRMSSIASQTLAKYETK